MSRSRYAVAALIGVVVIAVVLALRARSRSRASASIGVSAAPAFTQRVAHPLDVAEAVYDRGLSAGWDDWCRGSHEVTAAGPLKIVLRDYGAVVLHHAELKARFGGLSFRYQAPAAWSDFLRVSMKSAGSADGLFPEVAVRREHTVRLDDGWLEVLVEWRELNPSGAPFDRIVIQPRSQLPGDSVLLDKIVLTRAGAGGKAAQGSARRVDLRVFCERAAQHINPLIYGGSVNDWDSGMAARRIGGNPLTRFNWELGVWNAGSDWFFLNMKPDGGLPAWLADASAHQVPVALVVPTIGWVSKDATSFGFPVSKHGKQRKVDPERPEAGDGYRPDGTKLAPGPGTETSIPAPPELIGKWIRDLRQRDRERGGRSVTMYILDNEPSLWSTTHRDVHPEPLGYDELLDRTVRYAEEVRRADPEALIAGPAEWGWLGYFFSGKDREAGVSLRPDRTAHGGAPLVPWYLQKLAEYEKTKGTRLLDVLDVHFYPAAEGLYGANARVDPEGAALRIRSTRALWDPSYEDESWIKEPISLIPRLKEWVSLNYPGRSLSLGEWSFGGDQHISGALAVAEALGRFGQQGLDAAFYWDGPKRGSKTYWAFRAYRNFDGAGGRFLDWSLPTREAEGVSLFASRDETGSHVVAILVNQDPNAAVTARVDLGTCGAVLNHRVFAYGADSAQISPQPEGERDSRGLETTLSPYSLQVVDITLQRRPQGRAGGL